MTRRAGGREESDERERRVRLRLTVAVPAAVVFVALAAGVGAVGLLRITVPEVEADGNALLWAHLTVAGFAVLSGAGAWLFARRLHQTFWQLVDEVRGRLEGERSVPAADGGAGGPVSGSDGERLSGPVEEYELVRRTLGAYLQRVDRYRLDAELLEEIQEAVLVLDGDGRIRRANRRAVEMLGVAGDDRDDEGGHRGAGSLRGRRLQGLIPDGPDGLPLRSFVRRALDYASSEDAPRREAALREEVTMGGDDGEARAIRAKAHFPASGDRESGRSEQAGPDRAPGGRAGRERILLALSPVSEEERAAVERERRNRLAELGMLVAEVAHEVRNPLGGLRGMVDLLAEDLPDADGRREMLQTIGGQVEEVTRYLDEILDYAQPRQLELGPVDLREVAEAAVAEVRGLAEEEGVELELDGEARARLRADRRRLKQVLVNLLQNGIQHAPKGGRVSVALGAAESDDAGPPAAEVSVFNTGSFLPEERRAEVFQPFVTTNEGGTGLGLTVSRYLVNLHGGSIRVESEEDVGTTFRVRLPAGEDS